MLPDVCEFGRRSFPLHPVVERRRRGSTSESERLALAHYIDSRRLPTPTTYQFGGQRIFAVQLPSRLRSSHTIACGLRFDTSFGCAIAMLEAILKWLLRVISTFFSDFVKLISGP